MHGLSPDEELDHWRSQARHWQAECERLQTELGNAPAQEAYDAVCSALATAQEREATLRHELANERRANVLSDEDHALLFDLASAVRARVEDHGIQPRIDSRYEHALVALDRLLARGRDV